MPPLHKRFRLVDVHVVGFVPLLPTDNEDIAEAVRRNQTGLCTLSLENGVGGNRCGVQNRANRASMYAGLQQELFQSLDHRHAGICRAGRNLECIGRAGSVIAQNEIRECSSNVKRDTDHVPRAPCCNG